MRYLCVIVVVLLSLRLAAAQGQPQYPNYGQPQGWYGVLPPQDQQQFDKYYSKWVDAQSKNDQDDVANNARKMQQIMARCNIPSNVPFAAIATNGYAAAPNGSYAHPYPYAYGQSAQRLSAKDQSHFDKAYRKWLVARRKKDRDDVDKNVCKMQEIMARYNIPANVPFDRIASQASPY
jgi:TRAP-type C4-dicarboxylate transport system substrate-binding protein